MLVSTREELVCLGFIRRDGGHHGHQALVCLCIHTHTHTHRHRHTHTCTHTQNSISFYLYGPKRYNCFKALYRVQGLNPLRESTMGLWQKGEEKGSGLWQKGR